MRNLLGLFLLSDVVPCPQRLDRGAVAVGVEQSQFIVNPTCISIAIEQTVVMLNRTIAQQCRETGRAHLQVVRVQVLLPPASMEDLSDLETKQALDVGTDPGRSGGTGVDSQCVQHYRAFFEQVIEMTGGLVQRLLFAHQF